ncbi:tyrosine-type recombinase/integrase [Roseimaritima sediminicola]|uniref:tyrosine-type recombinase/integrase n=1 Tax=Roseimaritima sediminicola TaxID=2662066 RepID=UPI0012983083
MASLRKESDRGRNGWRLRFYLHGKRRSLWIGDSSKRAADTIARHVEELARAAEANVTADAGAVRWVESLEGRMRDTLTRWGLCDASDGRLRSDEGRLLGPFLDAYIARRTDVAARTTETYRQAKRFLVEHFGADRPLRSITAADAEQWRRWLLTYPVRRDKDGKPLKTMAEATVAKHVKRARLLFSEAVRGRLIDSSPFAAVKIGSQSNPARHHFVDRQTTAAVLDACPDHDWRLIFAFARFAGMRAPSEVLGMRWSDVLWDTNRLRIDSPKTGLRFCPIFPELRPILDEAYHDAPEGAVYCIHRYRGGETNLSTMLHRIIERAGCVPWEKTYINLRSTRRTELQEAFASHVVDAWLGHSSRVADEHYLQVTSDHWDAAATKPTGTAQRAIMGPPTAGGPTGGPIPALSQCFTAESDVENVRNPAPKDSKTLGKNGRVGQAGLEPATKAL